MSIDRPVLFVCLHGAAKSVLAAADFRRIAPGVLRTLLAEGVDLRGQAPRRVTRADVVAAARVVAFGCDLGEAVLPGTAVEQWTDVPAVSDDLPAARAVIRGHLERLVDECARARSGRP